MDCIIFNELGWVGRGKEGENAWRAPPPLHAFDGREDRVHEEGIKGGKVMHKMLVGSFYT